MKARRIILSATLASLLGAPAAMAQSPSPAAGWQAELSQDFHGVSGTVVVLDEDTLQVNDFTYDGGGISVYFYLGAEDSQPAFTSGLEIGPQLFGTAFDGTQAPLEIDLPAGETIDGWNAISVWCVAAGVSFGSGTFQPPPGDFNSDGVVDAADYTVWRDNDSGAFTPADYEEWRSHYGAVAAAPELAAASTAPEPAALCLLAAALAGVRRRNR